MGNNDYIDAETFTKITDKNIMALASVAIRLASDVLSAGQFNILSELVNGKSVTDIAIEYNRKESSIRSSITKSIKAIRKRLSEMEFIKPKFVDFKSEIEERSSKIKEAYFKEIAKLKIENDKEKEELTNSLNSIIENKDCENYSLKTKVDYLSISLENLKKLSLKERTIELCNELISDVKAENLELNVKIQHLNEIITSLHKQVERIAQFDSYYNPPAYLTNEELAEKIHIGALLKKKLSDYNLSVRAQNIAKKLNLEYIEDLVSLQESELINVKGCGENTLEEFENLVERLDLRFGNVDKEAIKIYQSYIEAKRNFDMKYPIEQMIENKKD